MSDEYGRDFNRILAGDDLLAGGQEQLRSERPVSRREQIARMREQAREEERQRNFRTGLLAIAAIAATIVALIVIAVGG